MSVKRNLFKEVIYVFLIILVVFFTACDGNKTHKPNVKPETETKAQIEQSNQVEEVLSQVEKEIQFGQDKIKQIEQSNQVEEVLSQVEKEIQFGQDKIKQIEQSNQVEEVLSQVEKDGIGK